MMEIMESKKDCINVSVRIRPVLNQDSTSSSCLQIISKEPPVLLVLERSQTYHFDNIFSEDADQQKVYDDAVKPFVNYVKLGYNCTVFAYGQTGTGKTYTMGSGSQKPIDTGDAGIIPRALEQLFNEEELNSDQEIEIFISFSEIYNEKVFDLFQPDMKAPLPVAGFVVQGLSIKNIKSIQEAKVLLELGNKHRHVGETKQNMNSSRSHAIFTVYYSLKNSRKEISGKLHLVDLAGSESVRKTMSKGSTFKEGVNINKGLLSIGQVISALSLKASYVPYRQSMITSILQGSLNADNYISLIACLSANPDDITETLQTLDFAQRVKKVRNKPEVNQIIAKYKKDHPGAFGFVRTPMKRTSGTPLKTPAAKKIVFPLLPLIDESGQSQMSNVDSSKNQFSIDVSSVSSLISASSTDMTQQTLSPVIRKYMTKMEESIMDRLETVIKSTLRRPTRASLLAEKSLGDDKENTPSVSWNKIQNKLSKMVRNEIAQMSVQTVRATSSPIEEMDKDKARRVLHYDSPDNIDISTKEATKSISVGSTNVLFKVPNLPLQKKKKNIPSISPIKNQMPKLTPRRSTRLSLKKMNNSADTNNSENNSILNVSEISFDSDIGVRPMEKSMENVNCTLNDSICGFSLVTNKQSQQDDSDHLISGSRADILNSEKQQTEHSLIMSSRRRSVRVAKKKEVSHYKSPQNSNKRIGYNVAMTPAKILLRKQKTRDSPYTAHSKNVLKVLNVGTLRDVEKLHTVGSKTAEQILLFRKLKGSLNKIEDLTKLPGWGTKKYDKFVALNFLRKE